LNVLNNFQNNFSSWISQADPLTFLFLPTALSGFLMTQEAEIWEILFQGLKTHLCLYKLMIQSKFKKIFKKKKSKFLSKKIFPENSLFKKIVVSSIFKITKKKYRFSDLTYILDILFINNHF